MNTVNRVAFITNTGLMMYDEYIDYFVSVQIADMMIRQKAVALYVKVNLAADSIIKECLRRGEKKEAAKYLKLLAHSIKAPLSRMAGYSHILKDCYIEPI